MRESVTAVAHSNIALSKYWGKRSVELNLPAVSSISMTLEGLSTRTTLARADLDAVLVNGEKAGAAFASRVIRFLDLLRGRVGSSQPVEVRTENNFPTGAGLASSASGFAALALAGAEWFELDVDDRELSTFARQGSGSASRSIFGGFVEWHRGEQRDGSDSFAEQIAGEDHWDVRMLVAITSDQEKSKSSTDGMLLTRQSSPYYDAWVQHSEEQVLRMREAIKLRDLSRVGELMEASCLQMHAVMMSATPGLLYWNPATVALIHAVRQMRSEGLESFFTVDAGPQVKVLCRASEAATLTRRLNAVPGVLRVLEAKPGSGAHIEAPT